MAKKRYLEKKFPIECRGRDKEGNEVFSSPVNFTLKVYQGKGYEEGISSDVSDCPYNIGAHGEKCNATNTINSEVYCPLAFDLPHALDKK